jgi:hypothetical protein
MVGIAAALPKIPRPPGQLAWREAKVAVKGYAPSSRDLSPQRDEPAGGVEVRGASCRRDLSLQRGKPAGGVGVRGASCRRDLSLQRDKPAGGGGMRRDDADLTRPFAPAGQARRGRHCGRHEILIMKFFRFIGSYVPCAQPILDLPTFDLQTENLKLET